MNLLKLAQFLNKEFARVLFWTSMAFCILCILSIGLGILPLFTSCFSNSFCYKLNQLLINLSYSYIAGCIFYLLSVVMPKRQRKTLVMPALSLKINNIREQLRIVLLEFSRDTQWNPNEFDMGNCFNIMMSKNWTNKIPFAAQYFKVDITYLHHIYNTKSFINKEIDEIITSYKEYLTENQLVLLEEIRNASVFKTVTLFVGLQNINLEDPKGKRSLVDDFCNLIKKYNSLEKSTKIVKKKL